MATNNAPIIVYTPFNHAWGGRTFTPEWIAERVDFYLRYTVPSLLRQTVAPWAILLDCRPGSEKEIFPHQLALAAAGMVATFDRGVALLADLPADADSFYLLRIDSDDLYGPDALECVAQLQGAAKCSQFYLGYVWHLSTHRLARIALRSPPFYSIRFARGEIRSMAGIAALLPARGNRRGHSVVRELLAPVRLPDGRYCHLRHGQNCGRDLRGIRVSDPDARAEVFGGFGIGG